MSFGKANVMINIVQIDQTKDAEGFSTRKDTTLSSVRAYKEDRHGNKRWASLAVFSEATALFRFRRIPSLIITTEMVIVCEDERYEITSLENVRGRGMYTEVLAKKVVSNG